MTYAQQIFVLLIYWWKYMGLGLAKNIRDLEVGEFDIFLDIVE